MRRYRPTLLSPFGRAMLAIALTTMAVISICGGAYFADRGNASRVGHLVFSEDANG
jgi:hypothetical protein